MPFKQFLFIGFLWALFAGQLLAGDGKPYNFGHIDYKIGLSNNHVQCFAEDNNGFLWIGTQSGLNRYDGYGFKTFKHNPDDSSSLPSNVIQSIVKDQLGRFWIHLPYDMCIFNPNNEEFVNRFTLVTEKKTYQNFNIDLVVPFGDSILFFNIPGEGIIEHNIFTNQNRFFLSASSTDWPDISISHVAAHGSNLYITCNCGIIEIHDERKCKPIKTILFKILNIKKLVQRPLESVSLIYLSKSC